MASPPLRETVDYDADPWRQTLYTGIFCFAITILLTMTSASSFTTNLIVSFSIGGMIRAGFYLLGDIFQRHLSAYIAAIPITAIGLGLGLLTGGTLAFGQPFYFFTASQGTLAVGVFFGILGFIIFSTRGRLMAAEARLAKASAQQAKQEKLLTETELKLLQAQIEPHFLFNTLSNIAGLIHQDPTLAETTLVNLTTLLRTSLNSTRQATTALSQELEIAQAYLDIQATRMRGRLTYQFDTTAELSTIPLPPLLLQPLIENAIKHGIEPSETGGHIDIHVQQLNNDIHITIADTGLGISSNPSTSGSGTGLSNIRERLRILYGNEASFTLKDNHPTGTIACITLPLEPRTKNATSTNAIET